MPLSPEHVRPAASFLVRGLSAACALALLALTAVAVRDEWARVTARPWAARSQALFATVDERVDAVDAGRALRRTAALIEQHVPPEAMVLCVFHRDEPDYWLFFRTQAMTYPRHLLAWVIETNPVFETEIAPELKRRGVPLFVADFTAGASFPRSELFDQIVRTDHLTLWRSREVWR